MLPLFRHTRHPFLYLLNPPCFRRGISHFGTIRESGSTSSRRLVPPNKSLYARPAWSTRAAKKSALLLHDQAFRSTARPAVYGGRQTVVTGNTERATIWRARLRAFQCAQGEYLQREITGLRNMLMVHFLRDRFHDHPLLDASSPIYSFL